MSGAGTGPKGAATVCPDGHPMRWTRAGWQCPTDDAHAVCTVAVCGHDAATGDCGINAAASANLSAGRLLPRSLACINERHATCDGRSPVDPEPVAECSCYCHYATPADDRTEDPS